MASRDFENEFRKVLAKSHPSVQEKLKVMLKKWTEVEFKGDPQLSLIPSLYASLKKEYSFSSSDTVVSSSIGVVNLLFERVAKIIG